ncbi:L-type lectin-domain containing receptor kinase IX.1 [Vitis vinifera]|uniref:non-specific serine/threonine protein kinase n=1 Tax=Vitis vinifera TaxID=29760 RepID=A0A438H0I9_VITVI|nr:L-type lectin-domain containing receptor kinase IX.1 [Vitis vinifera]
MGGCNTHMESHKLLSFHLCFLISIFFLLCATSVPMSFNITSFHQNADLLRLEGDALYSSDAIELTTNARDKTSNRSWGRAIYKEQLYLWDKTSGNLTDFSTNFSFVINSLQDNSYGDGLTFFLSGTQLPSDVSGSGLGLVNSSATPATNSTTNSTTIRFVAVEFDTYPNSATLGDPRKDHVGVNINSMISVKTMNWSNDITNGKFNFGISPRRAKKTELVVGLSVCAFVVVGGLALVWFYLRKKRNTGGYQEDGGDSDQAMDEDFEKEGEKLGEGGFGGVYRGFLRELNSYVAVKRVTRNSQQGMKEYASEVKIFCRLRHRNLVQLMGWCHKKEELLLVYELLPNGSLSTCLFEEKTLLTWAMRYRIALGLASSLLYLHEEWEQCVVHRDIKSSNVMLDSDFNAKLGDFGLARLVDHGKGSQTTVLAGTMGYMAPECFTTGKASKESDVYSFGIVALEICCGRRAVETKAEENQIRLVEWVWGLYGVGKLLEAADPRLSADYDEQQMERLMIVGLWCAHPDCNARPSMRQAMSVLNSEALLPLLPIKMPVPMYYAPPALQTSYSTSVSERKHTQFSNSTDSSKLSESSSTLSQSASLLHAR